MPGYFKNATATAETLVDDWCHTGDIGYYDSQGRVFIEDRKKELIKVKGLQVAPAELENVLRGMDGVADVAVVGVPDQRAGELPRAYIVKKGDDLTEEQVKSLRPRFWLLTSSWLVGWSSSTRSQSQQQARS